jgi:hypothetical protein
MLFTKILLVMLLFYSTHTAPPVVKQNHHILFEELGKMAPVAGYMHIRIPVPVNPFLKYLKHYTKEFQLNREHIKKS